MADKADAFAKATSMDDTQNGNIRDATVFFASLIAYSNGCVKPTGHQPRP